MVAVAGGRLHRARLSRLLATRGVPATLTALLLVNAPVAGHEGPAGATPRTVHAAPPATAGGFSCDTIGKGMVNGTPDVAAGGVPAIRSVQLEPSLGGLLVVYRFGKGFTLAPEGVYFAWTVYIYHRRSDAGDATRSIELQIEDRGLGWEPSGWSVLASTYYNSSPVHGDVHTDGAHDKIATFFPAGFANLKPPFYWYASQEVFRGYLPRKSKTAHQDFKVNGSIVNDCPGGVRTGTYGLPDPAKLLAAN